MLKLLTAFVLVAGFGPAEANIYSVDLSNMLFSNSWSGPCYCESIATITPALSFAPGITINFGEVTVKTFQSGPTPDGGLNQPNLYIQGGLSYNFGPPNIDLFPPISGASGLNFTLCNQNDAACNNAAQNSSVTFDLIFTIPANDSDIQLGWVGPYSYVAPAVPEPSTWAMMLIGFAGLGLFASARLHRRRFS
jgi:hypothetical protein